MILGQKKLSAAAFITSSALLSLLLPLSPVTSVAFAADEAKPIGKVLSVKQSGYATRLQQSVKHTVKPGDTLYSGDQIDVKSGNVVQIALDADQKNIIHIPGDSLVQLTKDRTIDLGLSHGQVFALLDKLEPGTKFRVVTPTAVSTVRGTYFGVKMAGTATETSVYRGGVGVNGRLADGKSLGGAVVVAAGDKTMVDHVGTGPREPKRMTAAEFNRINDVIAMTGGLKKPLDYNMLDFEKADADKAAAGANDVDVRKTAKDKDLDKEESAGGKVVF